MTDRYLMIQFKSSNPIDEHNYTPLDLKWALSEITRTRSYLIRGGLPKHMITWPAETVSKIISASPAFSKSLIKMHNRERTVPILSNFTPWVHIPEWKLTGPGIV